MTINSETFLSVQSTCKGMITNLSGLCPFPKRIKESNWGSLSGSLTPDTYIHLMWFENPLETFCFYVFLKILEKISFQLNIQLHLIINNLKLLTVNCFGAGQRCSNFLLGTKNSCPSSLVLRLGQDHFTFLLKAMLTFRIHYEHPPTFTLNKLTYLALVWLSVYAGWGQPKPACLHLGAKPCVHVCHFPYGYFREAMYSLPLLCLWIFKIVKQNKTPFLCIKYLCRRLRVSLGGGMLAQPLFSPQPFKTKTYTHYVSVCMLPR